MSTNNKKLYRLPEKRMIFGVCAGLAEYFEMDVIVVRLIFVLLLLATGGTMIFLYVIIALIMPVPGSSGNETIDKKVSQLGRDIKDSKTVGYVRNIVGISIIALGSWMLIAQFYPQLTNIHWDYVWPVLLIIAGLLIIVGSNNHEK